MIDLAKRWQFKTARYYSREFFPSTASYQEEDSEVVILGYIRALGRNQGTFLPCGAVEQELEEIKED